MGSGCRPPLAEAMEVEAVQHQPDFPGKVALPGGARGVRVHAPRHGQDLRHGEWQERLLLLLLLSLLLLLLLLLCGFTLLGGGGERSCQSARPIAIGLLGGKRRRRRRRRESSLEVYRATKLAGGELHVIATDLLSLALPRLAGVEVVEAVGDARGTGQPDDGHTGHPRHLAHVSVLVRQPRPPAGDVGLQLLHARGVPAGTGGGHTWDGDAGGGGVAVLAGDLGGGVRAQVELQDGALGRLEARLELLVVEGSEIKPHPLWSLPHAVASACLTTLQGKKVAHAILVKDILKNKKTRYVLLKSDVSALMPEHMISRIRHTRKKDSPEN